MERPRLSGWFCGILSVGAKSSGKELPGEWLPMRCARFLENDLQRVEADSWRLPSHYLKFMT